LRRLGGVRNRREYREVEVILGRRRGNRRELREILTRLWRDGRRSGGVFGN
jgi:hypothetical protein